MRILAVSVWIGIAIVLLVRSVYAHGATPATGRHHTKHSADAGIGYRFAA
jgi:hypothetical protein